VNASINPRSDGITVGNMMERGNWSLDINEEVRQQNVDAAIKFYSGMRGSAPVRPPVNTTYAPPRVIPALESFYGPDL